VTIFVDTSALFAALDRDDRDHSRAVTGFAEIVDERLVTHNYVVLETDALARRRLGSTASQALFEHLLPPLEMIWVDEPLHHAAVALYLRGGKTRLSLVDCTSFSIMQAHGIGTAFAFDDDFARAGYETIP
jgi:predicted nucleic acid-binding protein